MGHKKKLKIAICYDFDGTLIEGNMQENSFIPEIKMDKDEFWNEVKKHAEENDMDEVLAYMQIMTDKTRNRRPFNKESMRKHGKGVKLFKGVEGWFKNINTYQKNNVTIEHYVISSGLDEMIRGSKIGKCFKYIYASGFFYDANGAAAFPARSVNYTTKVQYLFRISRGIKNSWDNTEINKPCTEEERIIPFSQMLYIGDGDTDIPAMKMINYKKGYSIAVYPPKSGSRITKEVKVKKQNVEQLKKDNRCQFIAEADYSKDSRLYNIVTSLIDRIVKEHEFEMNLKA